MGNCNSNRSHSSHCSETPVFADQDLHFRIPALLYVKEWDAFLAFAEKRESEKDEHAKNLVMSRGRRQQDGTLQWSHFEDLTKATKDGYRTMNPCPVFEAHSKTLFLFFICLKGEIAERDLKPGESLLCYVTSSDCGKTWSDLTDRTDVVVSSFRNYQTFAVGPGHGIQLSNGTLLIPTHVKVAECDQSCAGCSGCVKTYSVVLHSQDQHTWHVGQHSAMRSGECQVAEVSDGEGKRQVYLNGRSDGKFRVEELSDNGGKCFSVLSDPTFKERPHGCQGSILALCQGSQETALLFSYPTAGEGWNREELGLYTRRSLQDHTPWEKLLVIHPGKSGYSDLTHGERVGHFACLMECGEMERLRIVFREFRVQTSFHITAV